MPARRPYASRGVPRRATTRRPGRSGLARRVIPAAILALVVIGAACAWVINPFVAGARIGTTSVAGVTANQAQGGGSDALGLNAVPNATAQLAQDLAATPPAGLTTTRQWDASVPGIVNDPVLASRLDQALVGVDGHVGVAVKDLGSGRGAVLGGDLELQSASLYKLPVLYTVFDLGVPMSDELTITPEALTYDSGTMELGPGETLTVAEALERMVTLSDNTSAILLGDRVGAGNVTASIAALGMDTTHYSLERMTTSALDMLHFLEAVAAGKAVSSAASADMLHLMLRQRVNDRLPRLLSDDVQIAHKTGNLPGVVNDVGILYGPNSTVAVAVLVSDTTDETAAATAIAQIGQVSSGYFENQPAAANRPQIPPAPSRPIPPVWREPHPVPQVPAVAVVPTSSTAVHAEATAARVPTATVSVTTTSVPVVGLPTAIATVKPTQVVAATVAPPAATAAAPGTNAGAPGANAVAPPATVVAPGGATAVPAAATATRVPPPPPATATPVPAAPTKPPAGRPGATVTAMPTAVPNRH